MIDYEPLNARQAQQVLPQLCDVLQACVVEGASIGFVNADDREVITQFWQNKIRSLASGECELLVARQHGVVAGTVMVNYSSMPNGRHRAEISKLLVRPQARRQGIARQLMQQAEQRAREQDKVLLVLDTRSGDVASDLYLSLGWQIAGSIPFYAESTAGILDATTVMFKVLKDV